jgi:mannosylglycerate hydrolase
VNPRVAFLVSHTHWDREWYQTFGEFRVDMDRAFRAVFADLETGRLDHFVLDGQAILLEDYLAGRPEDRERIRNLVATGRLAVGPWYILPDEFLVSGEATVRNLLLGHQAASDLGGVQKVGYMPDSFGHVAQVPQILRGAGIDSFIYTRGNGDEIDRLGWEFAWRSPDGSEVLAINQVRGYCNAGGLGMHEIWHAHTPREVDSARAVEQVREIFEAHAERARSDVVLLNNGCDHFPPPRDRNQLVAALREAFPETAFRTGGFPEYLKAVRDADPALESFEGELLGGRLHHILSGVWSTRMYLKQANERAEVLLAEVVEPLAACSHFLAGADYPAGQIDTCWRELLQNHPHDSICGCSTDEVHREMETRFESVVRTGEQLVRRNLKDLAPTFGPLPGDDGETVLCVANSLPFERTEVVRRLVVLQPPAVDASRLVLLDGAGQRVPCRIERVQRVERFWGIDYRVELDGERQAEKFAVYEDRFGPRILRPETEGDTADTFLTLEFLADLPALGHARFVLADTRETGGTASPGPDTSGPVPDPVRTDGSEIDNGLCRVRLHPNGSFDLLDRTTGREVLGLNILEDTEDVGDEYDFSRAARSETVSTRDLDGLVTTVREGGWSAILSAQFEMELPRTATADRQGRSDARVCCPVEVRVELRSGSPVVRVETRVDNRAEDHRLRALFPTGMRADHVWSDGHFLVNQRELPDPEIGEDWVQPPTGTYPQREYSLVQDEAGGLALLNRGLPEIEARRTDDGSVDLSLTLLRSVGWLSRDDFESRRRSNAGPTLFTPEAQCPGTRVSRYAVLAFQGDFRDAGVRSHNRRYRVEPVSVQGVLAGSAAGGRSLVRQESGRATITAIKKHERRDTLVVRLYNPFSESIEETLRTDATIARAWLTDLLEERTAELPAGTNQVDLAIGAHQILTVEFEIERP